MTEDAQLQLLKRDLQKPVNSTLEDEYLKTLLEAARSFIKTEGVTLEETVECGMMVSQYAAYLYRRRAASDTTMPRFLRFELNCLKLKQRGATNDE